jgi:hypothetical protein
MGDIRVYIGGKDEAVVMVVVVVAFVRDVVVGKKGKNVGWEIGLLRWIVHFRGKSRVGRGT